MDYDINKITWFFLILAIVLEVSGTIAMKLSEGFTKIAPLIAMFIFYMLGLSVLALVLKRIDVGVAYAVWSGLGTALIATVGVLWFKEPLSTLKVISIGLIVLGVVGLHVDGH